MTSLKLPPISPDRLDHFLRLAKGIHGDPFAVLGPHEVARCSMVTAFVPDAARLVAVTGADGEAHDLPEIPEVAGIFTGEVPEGAAYTLRATGVDGREWAFDDPYRFGPVAPTLDTPVLAETTLARPWDVLGAHPRSHDGVDGVHFAVWAPGARRVSVVGGFNGWDGRRHPMRFWGWSGIWDIFIPDLREGEAYKYEIIGSDGALQPPKADPFGFGSEHPPKNASVVRDTGGYGWSDGDWMAQRTATSDRSAPISIYEVHLASWRRDAQGRSISYCEAAEALVTYAKDLNFTHIELMPISEHPFDGSWGYQPVGLFAPSIRHGPPHEFRDLIDAAHRAGLGVILDWVPGHFPTDPHGLGQFDGTALYEYADPHEGFHQDWNTLIYDYGSAEVRNFLSANARYWLEDYHVDGLRVDAVASMLYRDYSRKDGEWVPNADGGRENHEAIGFLRDMNAATSGTFPGAMTVAEESTAFPDVTHATIEGGLGFDFKWNMGWMFDTLAYVQTVPAGRAAAHHMVTFALTYAFSEAYVLPISHDEVVHGKGSMLGKMPGKGDTRFAHLRAYYGFMWGHPGKKLLFMGQEFAQAAEWDHAGQLDWAALDDPRHAGVQRLIRDLNALYRDQPALHARDCDAAGFQWIEADDTVRSVYVWLRRDEGETPGIVVISNFSTTGHAAYTVGLPAAGNWRVALSTDAAEYGGQGRFARGRVEARQTPQNGQPASAQIDLAPLSTVFLVLEP